MMDCTYCKLTMRFNFSGGIEIRNMNNGIVGLFETAIGRSFVGSRQRGRPREAL